MDELNSKYISREEHKEFTLRVDEEHKRTSKRLESLEKRVDDINDLAISVEKLAISVETIAKDLSKQGERLEKIEGRDGEMWRKVVSYVITTIAGLILGYIFTQIGL